MHQNAEGDKNQQRQKQQVTEVRDAHGAANRRLHVGMRKAVVRCSRGGAMGARGHRPAARRGYGGIGVEGEDFERACCCAESKDRVRRSLAESPIGLAVRSSSFTGRS